MKPKTKEQNCNIMDGNYVEEFGELVMKCGEVFLNKNGNLIMMCALCEIYYKEFQDYADHIMEKHFLLDILKDDDSSIKEYDDTTTHSFSIEPDPNADEVKGDYQLIEKIEFLDTVPGDEGNENKSDYVQIIPSTEEEVYEDPSARENKSVTAIKSYIYNCQSDPYQPSKMRYYCWECNKGLYSRTGYRSHSRSHTGERKYQCNRKDCRQTFITLDAYKRHSIYCATKGNDIECLECGRVFNDRGSFRKHMKTHSRPFKCRKCKVSLKTAKSLEIHMKSHKETHEYVCQICSINFNDQTGLLTHLRGTHTDVALVKTSVRKI